MSRKITIRVPDELWKRLAKYPAGITECVLAGLEMLFSKKRRCPRCGKRF